MNTEIYAFVGLVLQLSQALGVTIPRSQKYNVPTGNLSLDLGDSTSTVSTYSGEAISGADDFVDGGVTAKDIFDIIVSNTRDITPTCRFSCYLPYLLNALTCPLSSWNCLVAWVSCQVSLNVFWF